MTLRELSQPQWLLSSLLIAGAALFAIGVAAERNANDTHTETGTETANTAEPGTEATAPTGEAAEAGGGEVAHTDQTTGEATAPIAEPAGEAAGHSESSNETFLGLNLESTPLVIIAAAASLALAAITRRRNLRALLFASMAFAVVFAVFDIAEVAHQIKESRSGLALLAATIALVHVVIAVVAEQRATSAPS